MKVFEIIDPTKMFGGFNLMGIGTDVAGAVSKTIGNPLDMFKPGNKDASDPEPSNKVVVVGDSLAAGIGGQIPGATVDAKVGINSSAVLDRANSNKELKGADVAIISAGANDGAGASGKNPSSEKTIANLKAIRAALGAKKYVWILPYNRSVAQDIMRVAGNDEVIDLAKTTTPSKDGIHPSSYSPVAKDAIKKGGVSPATTPSKQPATTPSKQPAQSSSTGGKGSVNTNDVKSYLSSKGLDRNQVAGIMANIKAESSFRPGAIGDNGTSGGLFQHHNERFSAMRKAAGPDWKNNWKGQIDFALTEPAGRQYAGMKFSSPEAASKWFTINFERPANMVSKANTRSASAANYA